MQWSWLQYRNTPYNTSDFNVTFKPHSLRPTTQEVARHQEAEKARTEVMMAEIRDLKSQIASQGEPPKPPPSDPRDDMLMKLMDKISELESSMKPREKNKGVDEDGGHPGHPDSSWRRRDWWAHSHTWWENGSSPQLLFLFTVHHVWSIMFHSPMYITGTMNQNDKSTGPNPISLRFRSPPMPSAWGWDGSVNGRVGGNWMCPRKSMRTLSMVVLPEKFWS